MKYFGLVLVLLLASCAEVPTLIAWENPTGGDVLSGIVRLDVVTQSDAPNAVFFVDGLQIGKANLYSSAYSVAWDTTSVAEGTHNLTVQPFGEPSSSIEVMVSRSVPGSSGQSPQESSDDPLNLNQIIRLSPPLTGIVENFPNGFDIGDLFAKTALSVIQLMALGQVDLPRGIYSYDIEKDDWVLEAGEENLTIAFSYDDGAPHDVTINVEYGETQYVESEDGTQEVPNELALTVEDNEEILVDLELSAFYAEPEGCTAQLEPSQIEATGIVFGGEAQLEPEPDEAAPEEPEEGGGDETPIQPGKAKIDEISFTLDYSSSEGVYDLVVAATSEIADGDLVALLELDTVITGLEERVGCSLSAFTPETLQWSSDLGMGENLESLIGNRISLELSSITLDEPVSAEIDAEITTYNLERDSEDVSTVLGILSDADGDSYPGEEAVLLSPRGTSRTLDLWIKDMFELYFQGLARN